jgi:hypothetical protein
MIFPTGGRTVLYGSLNWQTGNSETFPPGLCLPFNPPIPCVVPGSHLISTCLSRLLKLRPDQIPLRQRQSTLRVPSQVPCRKPALQQQEVVFFLLCGRVAVIPPQLGLVLLHGQVKALQTVQLLQDDSSNPYSSRLDNWQSDRTATLNGPVMTRAIHTPLGLIPGRAMGPSGKAKEAAQTSTIATRM